MSNSLSAKIIRKKVDYGKGWGGTDIYSFSIYHNGVEKWVSGFADPKKFDPDTLQLLKDLAEGDRAEFSIVENVSKKDGKTYLNIVGVVRETDVRDDVNVPAVAPGVQSVGHGKPEAPKKVDSRDEMMMKSYAKDGTNTIFQVACSNMDPNDDAVSHWIEIYDRIYAHIKGE